MVPSLVVKSNAGDNADVLLWGDPSTHRLLVSASGFTGSLTNNNAAPGATNVGALVAVANVAAPSWTEGNQVLLSTDLAGALRVTGTLSVGGTTDNSAFTAGSSTGTPAMGFYHSTIDAVTDGRSAVLAIDAKRNLFTVIRDAAGNARGLNVDASGQIAVTIAAAQTIAVTNAGTFATQAAATLAAETTKVIGTVRTLGNVGAVMDGVNTAAIAPANGLLTLGIYNSTEPGPTTGQSVGIQLDAKGRTRGVIMDAAGNTRGANVNASNQLSVSVDNTVTVGSHAVTNAGTFAVQAAITAASGSIGSGAIASGAIASGAIASGAVASGAVASGAFASGSIAAGAVAAGATSFVKLEDVASADADAGVPAMAVRKATPANTSGTDGDYEMLQMSAGRLWTSGIVAGSVATNVAIVDNPINLGAQAVSSENTAVTTARQVQLVADLVGKLIVLPYSNPENFVSGAITTAMTGTTTTSLIAAPAAGLRNYITNIVVSNAHATVGTDVIIQDGSGGTTLYTIPAAAVYGGASVTFPVPLRQPTTATAIFCANVTTGASTKVSATGYKGA